VIRIKCDIYSRSKYLREIKKLENIVRENIETKKQEKLRCLSNLRKRLSVIYILFTLLA